MLRAQEALAREGAAAVPFCAFNGGSDAWVDVGNKRVGVTGLQRFLAVSPEGCLHVGDQFLSTGNDRASRSCAPCAWVASPRETKHLLGDLLAFVLPRRHGALRRSSSLGGLHDALASSLDLKM